MTDAGVLTKNKRYLKAVKNIWQDIVSTKMYITGGIGARHDGEAFGNAYELPNKTAYCETCSAIGNIYWNYRLFLLYGDGKYIDLIERILYNCMISGVSLSGDSFFYTNPLESDGKFKFNMGTFTRQPWFDCSCCPTNVVRFMPVIPELFYAYYKDTIFINLFVSSTADIKLKNQIVRINQETEYPWDGKITVKIDCETDFNFCLKIRIPCWTGDFPLPSKLYRYLNKNENKPEIKINSKSIKFNVEKGFAVIKRKWKKGDTVELFLPMTVNKVVSDERVKENLNKVALVRGPLVFCAEGCDNDDSVFDIVIDDKTEIKTEFVKDLLDGVIILKADSKEKKLTAIPYYAWANRKPGEMLVWFRLV